MAAEIAIEPIIPSSEAIHTCTECGATYGSLMSLVAHARVHKKKAPPLTLADGAIPGNELGAPGSGAIHTCKECGATYGSRMSLVAHARVHKKKAPPLTLADGAIPGNELGAPGATATGGSAARRCMGCGKVFSSYLKPYITHIAKCAKYAKAMAAQQAKEDALKLERAKLPESLQPPAQFTLAASASASASSTAATLVVPPTNASPTRTAPAAAPAQRAAVTVSTLSTTAPTAASGTNSVAATAARRAATQAVPSTASTQAVPKQNAQSQASFRAAPAPDRVPAQTPQWREPTQSQPQRQQQQQNQQQQQQQRQTSINAKSKRPKLIGQSTVDSSYLFEAPNPKFLVQIPVLPPTGLVRAPFDKQRQSAFGTSSSAPLRLMI
jgi:uncharacterized C2H2 Zn-finger protein